MGAAADEFLRKRAAPQTSEEGSILVLTADGKGNLMHRIFEPSKRKWFAPEIAACRPYAAYIR
jgi:hypothetical protein